MKTLTASFIVLLFAVSAVFPGYGKVLENTHYILKTRSDGGLAVLEKRSGAEEVFSPDFMVIFAEKGRELKVHWRNRVEDSGPVGQTNYVIPSWGEERDFFKALGQWTSLKGERAEPEEKALLWRFPEQENFELKARASLPDDGSEPMITFVLRAKTPGQFSVGYAGAPSMNMEETDWIWQPLIWQGKRYPNRSYLTMEYQCPIPFTMLGKNGIAIGVGADVAEMPFRMPTRADSRFGVLIRNEKREAQPLIFSPTPGLPDSILEAGETYVFSVRLCVKKGSWFDAYRELASGLYGFGDVRENGLVSLNTTIHNMIRYFMTDRYSYWYPRYKDWGYQNDAGPDAGRQQSAGDALSIALVCDSMEVLEKRAVPTLEYMLSRNSASIKFSNPSYMGGKKIAGTPADLGAVYRLSGNRITEIRDILLKEPETALKRKPYKNSPIMEARMNLFNYYAFYQLSGDSIFLDRACREADEYIRLRIDREPESFKDAGSSFWTELAPPYDFLYELYKASGEKRYLEAAIEAMRQFSAYIYLVPRIPEEDFIANKGGVFNRQKVAEERVPSWRVAANGLMAECAGTAHSHRGIFMASHAACMLRLARDGGEPFFRDIGRSAIVGRYANYPSYAYRHAYTSLFEKPDHPYRPFEEMKKFTSAHYNHPLPMVAFLIDYLAADFYDRSKGAIDFPSVFTNTGGYFRNRLFGVAPGRFYDIENVNLILPRDVLETDTIQLNHILAWNDKMLCVGLSNQASEDIDCQLRIDADRTGLKGRRTARLWINNEEKEGVELVDGRVSLRVPAKGIAALAIEGGSMKTKIQEAVYDKSVRAIKPGGGVKKPTALGTIRGYGMRFGRGLTWVHIWTDSTPALVSEAVLMQDDGRELRCAEYPFEFSVRVPDGEDTWSGKLVLKGKDGREVVVPLSVGL